MWTFYFVGTGTRILPLSLKEEEHESQSSNLPTESTNVIVSSQEKEVNKFTEGRTHPSLYERTNNLRITFAK